ncbi:N-acetyltransferase [Lysinibacillus sp. BW-2-10]|uniref:GNAT family N-acetyltransferase n=1 Tax=Lysinibacillus sp. BW-2-10 TaxID=2590030 RepID=UPI002104D3EC|nr:GNAT family N-acetyltransferase [Lysinibacillus sp. BW-2-10]
METTKVREEESNFLFEVYESSRLSEVSTWGWEQNQITQFLKMQYQLQQQSYLIHYPNLETNIIYFQNKKVGRLLLANLFDKQVIVDITILPNYQNRGIGTYIISNILKDAKNQNKIVQLSVFYTNKQALKLYEQLGFKKVNQNEMYIQMEWSQVNN